MRASLATRIKRLRHFWQANCRVSGPLAAIITVKRNVAGNITVDNNEIGSGNMDIQEMYTIKKRTPAELAEYVHSNELIGSASALGQPPEIIRAIGARAKRGELVGVELVQNHMVSSGLPYIDDDMQGKFRQRPLFVNPEARKLVHDGKIDYYPCALSQQARMWEENIRPRVYIATASPMDRHGYFSMAVGGTEIQTLKRVADVILLEVSPHYPRVMGDNFIHISEITAFCETENYLQELPAQEYSKEDVTIASYIAERIEDGACLQFGIGRIPDAVGSMLMEKHDMGIHSEMFCTSMAELMKCGAVNNSRKNINVGRAVFTIAGGTQETYDFMDDNPSVEGHPCRYVNDPRIISQNDNVVSINGCLETDLVGQVCSESIGPFSISASGGQLDFVRGANWSRGGHSYLVMHSTAKKGTVSTIRPTLTPGAHVTTPKNEVDCIVTEYGIAELRGRSAAQRAKALIAIAHPDFRDELTFEARKNGLMV